MTSVTQLNLLLACTEDPIKLKSFTAVTDQTNPHLGREYRRGFELPEA